MNTTTGLVFQTSSEYFALVRTLQIELRLFSAMSAGSCLLMFYLLFKMKKWHSFNVLILMLTAAELLLSIANFLPNSAYTAKDAVTRIYFNQNNSLQMQNLAGNFIVLFATVFGQLVTNIISFIILFVVKYASQFNLLKVRPLPFPISPTNYIASFLLSFSLLQQTTPTFFHCR